MTKLKIVSDKKIRNLTSTICLTLTLLLGSVGTGCGPDFNKGVAAYESGDFATALREWRPLAEQGVADAQYNLGVMYDKGEGVHRTIRQR